jgi:phage gpG-like protein
MDRFGFTRIRANIERTKRVLPVVLAKQAEGYFTKSFSLGKLGPTKWQEVNRRTPGTLEYKYPSKPKASARTSPILVRTGALRRKVSKSIANATWQQVRLVVDLPYAEFHNEGNDNTPARPFMKQTKELEIKQRNTIRYEMDKIWK